MAQITPWEVKGKVNYDQLMATFGIRPFARFLKRIPDHVLFRRGIVYGERDFERIAKRIENKEPFVAMTGFVPSGKFHFGHKIVIDQMLYYQALGAKVYIAIADIEAHNVRGLSIDKAKRIALEEYILNFIALGLKPEACDLYFQSARHAEGKKSNSYYRLALTASRHVTGNEIKAIYGEISPGKLCAALLQFSDMLHPQLKEFEGPIPTIIPVGFDQDPHIRLARDLVARLKLGFVQLSSTYHKFIPGLKGGKMSSSDPLSYIALTEDPDSAAQKIRKHAFSGGRATIAEHRKLGGIPEIDVAYQWLYAFFEPDDSKIKKIYHDYKSGALLSGELKEILIEKVKKFLIEHQKRRERARTQLDKFLVSQNV